MEELRADSEEHLEWEETARWIKFEEDVEEGTGRWGRPHISALAFHSLVDLRKGLEKGGGEEGREGGGGGGGGGTREERRVRKELNKINGYLCGDYCYPSCMCMYIVYYHHIIISWLSCTHCPLFPCVYLHIPS